MVLVRGGQWLIRPSDLARFWGLHPKTLYLWVRSGRLAAVRTPGGQYRVDAAAVRALAEQHALPVPPFLESARHRVIVVGGEHAMLADIKRQVRALSAEIEVHQDSYEGLVAAAISPPTALVLGPGEPGFDPLRCIRALRQSQATSGLLVLVHGVAGKAEERAARRAGADACVSADADGELGRELAKLLSRRTQAPSGRRSRPIAG